MRAAEVAEVLEQFPMGLALPVAVLADWLQALLVLPGLQIRAVAVAVEMAVVLSVAAEMADQVS
jgi:hypothetical protein